MAAIWPSTERVDNSLDWIARHHYPTPLQYYGEHCLSWFQVICGIVGNSIFFSSSGPFSVLPFLLYAIFGLPVHHVLSVCFDFFGGAVDQR
jgi:hypothetical protein